MVVVKSGQSTSQCNYRGHNEEDEDDDAENSDEEYTPSKSHCKPHLLIPESKQQKLRMTLRLPSLRLKLEIKRASQIEQKPLLPDLRPN